MLAVITGKIGVGKSKLIQSILYGLFPNAKSQIVLQFKDNKEPQNNGRGTKEYFFFAILLLLLQPTISWAREPGSANSYVPGATIGTAVAVQPPPGFYYFMKRMI